MKTFFLAILVFLISGSLQAQLGCSTLGQTPSTAFPVCGTTKFKQQTVPICANNRVPVPGCDGINVIYYDMNPYWYKFTCFSSGTLGFLITPQNMKDDYDWQLFDITGHQPNDVFTDSTLFVSGNWSGSSGLTGSSASAMANIQCASDPTREKIPTFSRWPTLIKGHDYLLLVSHFTQTQSGYSLSFGGGTASITDTVQPHMKSVSVSCDATKLIVKLNKRFKCSSLVANGSDFVIASGAASMTAASGFNCNNGFDMDSVQLTLDRPLAPGNYKLVAQNGKDNNTLLDNCDTPIPTGEEIPFAVLPPQPTPMDSISPIGCSPNVVRLVFGRGIRCNSIAPDGSDFRITGTAPITIVSARGECNNGLTSYIDVYLSAPIYLQGSFQIQLQTGTDGNTYIDECGQQTPPGASLAFQTGDTVSAQIDYQLLLGCKSDTIRLSNHGGSSINSWKWTLDGGETSTLPNPSIVYTVFGDKSIQLIVSNGICSDTAATTVSLYNTLKSDFETQDIVCPQDKSSFVNNSIGQIRQWIWDFGDGTGDFNQQPSDHFLPNDPLRDKIYPVSLVVVDSLGCRDTLTRQVRKLHSCYITVPNAFTPNGDGINDYLYPLNAVKADNLEFRVYNRYGQLVFETRDWLQKWDGRLGGKPQDPGTYVWTLQYTDRESGRKFFLKGNSVLIR